jgi:hypothetical protein
MVGREEIAALVAEQVALIEDPDRRDLLLRLLVEPRVETREWDYGAPGERFPYWVVAESPGDGVLLVYCEQGFGPGMPWGWLFTDDPEFGTLGMDAQWEWYLEAALIRSRLWRGWWAHDEPSQRPPEERFAGRRGEG